MKLNHPATLGPVLLLAFALLQGCSSTDLSKAVGPFRSGDFEKAAVEIAKVDANSEADGVWILMERGSIYKSAGLFDDSRQALEACNQRMDALIADAGESAVNVGGLAGAGAIMTDDRQCNYVGSLYEAQLVCGLQAMDSLMLSDLASAQASVSRLRDRVNEAKTVKQAVEDYLATQREENAKELAANREKYGEKLAEMMAGTEIGSAEDSLKQAYVSWADTSVGLPLYVAEIVQREAGQPGEFAGYLARSAEDAAQQTRAPEAYGSLAAGISNALTNLNSTQPGSTTYVIVESGLAPCKVVDQKAQEAWKEKGISDMELPTLQPGGRHSVALSVDGNEQQLSLMSDVRLLKSNEFQYQYPDVRYRAVTGKVIKKMIAAAGAATALASDDQTTQIIGALAFVGGSIMAAAQGADLRSWDCLPHSYFVVAFPTPDSGVIECQVDAGEGGKREVAVQPGASNLVVVTAVDSGASRIYSAPLRMPAQ